MAVIRRVPYIGYFSKKLPDVKEPSLSHIQTCATFIQNGHGYEYLYMWPSIPDAENPNNLYFKAWKWGYTQGTIYWLFFKEIAGCKRAKPVTYSKLWNIFPEWMDMSTYTCGLVCQMPKTPTIYISRHENGGIQEGTRYWLFFKEIAGCKSAKPVTYSKLCNIFPEWTDMSTYTCGLVCQMPINPNNLYLKAWKWRYTEGTIYWLFFEEIGGCKRAKPVTYSKLCNISPNGQIWMAIHVVTLVLYCSISALVDSEKI